MAQQGIVIRFVSGSATDGRTYLSPRVSGAYGTYDTYDTSAAQPQQPWSSWSASSPWPNHPAILPPLPRLSKSTPPQTPPVVVPRVPVPASPRQRQTALHPEVPGHRESARPTGHTTQRTRSAQTQPMTSESRRNVSDGKVESKVETRRAPQPARPAPREDLSWPKSFDDWMIDIVRRRALRLNSGARRRGAHGSVRAVELAHILERSKDAQGRWLCALCDEPVTLADLSFDHVHALADGGEHAAHNLVPAHRKCNEVKGSEKAQYRAQALDRWLTEWATKHDGAQPRGAARHTGHPGHAASAQHGASQPHA